MTTYTRCSMNKDGDTSHDLHNHVIYQAWISFCGGSPRPLCVKCLFLLTWICNIDHKFSFQYARNSRYVKKKFTIHAKRMCKWVILTKYINLFRFELCQRVCTLLYNSYLDCFSSIIPLSWNYLLDNATESFQIL